MALSIKNPETERLARELAAARGSSVTDAITSALRHELLSASSRTGEREAIFERTMAIGRDASTRWPEEVRNVAHGDLLYDEDGLPR